MVNILFVDFIEEVIDFETIKEISNYKFQLIIREDLDNIIEKNVTSDYDCLGLALNHKNELSELKALLSNTCLRHYSYSKFSPERYKANIYKYISRLFDFLEREKITHIIFNNIPHEPHEYLLAFTAKLKNIETLSFYSVGGYLQEFSSIHINAPFSNSEIMMRNKDNEEIEKSISNIVKKYRENKALKPVYVPNRAILPKFKLSDLIKRESRFLLSSLKYKKLSYLISSVQYILDELLNFKNYTFRLNNHNKIVDYSVPYIYLPMQYEPELSSTILFNGQVVSALEIILAAREKFGESINIICKENPSQLLHNRSSDFFKIIDSIPNLYYLADASHEELLKNCTAVALGRGTPGVEALLIGKPIYGITKNWYFDGLGNNLLDSQKTSLEEIYKSKNPSDNFIFKTLSQNIFDVQMQTLYLDVMPNFNKKNNTIKSFSIIDEWIKQN